ncbi:MAG: hypothetical protein ACI8W1_001584 [Candidatus Azotimanducaceae bacterium]
MLTFELPVSVFAGVGDNLFEQTGTGGYVGGAELCCGAGRYH